MKDKILVLENLDEMEPVLAEFINKYFPDANVNFMGHLKKRSPEEVLAAINNCTHLLVMSIFNETKPFEGVVKMMASMKKKPIVYIIHSTQKFLQFLNLDISKPTFGLLKDMLQDHLLLYNVYYTTFEGETKPGAFFKNLFNAYAIIPMWYNSEFNLIFDEHQHVVETFKPAYYKKKTFYLESLPSTKPEKHFLNDLNIPELKELKNILKEVAHQLSEREEDIDSGITARFCNATEVKEITAEVKKRKKLLEKLNIHN